jgi:DNA-binding HxlR family transcriptional regulator
MQKYKQYCPVARASEILADRWTPLIVRELILGSHRFNEIERGLPGISRSLLASRLRDLEDAGVVERLPAAQSKVTAYHLSEAGRDLKTVIETLGAWGVRWAFGEPKPEELDAGLLIWRIHQRINRE